MGSLAARPATANAVHPIYCSTEHGQPDQEGSISSKAGKGPGGATGTAERCAAIENWVEFLDPTVL